MSRSYLCLLGDYCSGDAGAGKRIFVSCFAMNSRVGGGHVPLFTAASRVCMRSSSDLYDQMWTHRFSGPFSLYPHATSGDIFTRFSILSPQILITLPMVPGLSV